MSAIAREAAALIQSQRWSAIATLDEGRPLASMVAYAIDADAAGLLLFVSQLAQHTRNMLAARDVSLAVSEPDDGEGDPQRLQRATITGTVTVVSRGSARFDDLAQRYVDRFPDALPRFELGDFVLLSVTPGEVRYVGGVARAARFSWEAIRAALKE
jgi:putative heme iron utilization protein